ncbi:Glycerate dehydrogenase [Roseobacter fucihabitans]|uniref:Glycerate dehydrogenase n=1 Tax=Roseobacter fucihabitans TaxID=1537242 RepID=A0ABZ2BLN1_9RHOB|nr:D-glycerate dehydrogenase [Roseobacter litoralis]MBC6963362.1 Glycerate dehydrogenase [Roseobacter litoralis]
MIKPKVLVTRRWPAAVEAQLCEKFDVVLNKGDVPLMAHEFRQAFMDFDAVLPTVTDKIGVDALDLSGPRTKLLANYGVGYTHIDMPSAMAHGMTVTNTPDVLSECTADLAMTLMLMAARRAGEGEREIREGRWSGWRPMHLVGTKVSGKTLGIVGFGRIGQEMARRAHHGFGMKIIVHNRSRVAPEVLARYNAVQADDLDDLLPRCDFVSLHCPGGAENRHLINSRRLDLMRPDAFLINTARGEVINEYDLVQALAFETIGGAALDVFDGEPNIAQNLLDSDRLVMLPHLGSATSEAREEMGFRVMNNLQAFFEGQTPPDRVN